MDTLPDPPRIQPRHFIVNAYRELAGGFPAILVRYWPWLGALVILTMARQVADRLGLSILVLELVRTGLEILELYALTAFGIDIVRQRFLGDALGIRAASPFQFRFWRSFVLGFVISCPLLLASVYNAVEDREEWIWGTLTIGGVCWALFLIARMFAAQPMIAIDFPGSAVKTSWQMTRGNGWSVLTIVVVLALPFIVLMEILGLPEFSVETRRGLQRYVDPSSLIPPITWRTGVDLVMHPLAQFLIEYCLVIAGADVYRFLTNQQPGNPDATISAAPG